VCFKRPGTGLAPFELARVLGRVVVRPLTSDTPLTSADLAPAGAEGGPGAKFA